RAEMKLFCPAFFAIQPPKEQHHEGHKICVFCIPCGLARADAAEDVLRNRRCAEIDEAVVKGMIRHAAAGPVKIIMALLEGIEKAVQIRHLYVGRDAQVVDPGIESFRIPDSQSPVRPKGRKDADLET